MRPGPIAFLAPLALVLTACGDPSPTPGADDRGWDTELVAAEVGADQSPLLATSGEDVLLVTVSEDGTLTSHLSRGGGSFETGEPRTTGPGYPQFGGVVAMPDGGWLTMGSSGPDDDGFDPLVFHSTDGLAWKPVEVTGFADAADINALAVIEGVVVAGGSYRTAEDPSSGGFEAHVWTSRDGASFTEVDLPGVRPPRGYRNESYVADLALVGDRLLAVGAADGAAVWTSEDAATWHRVDDPALDGLYAATRAAVSGDIIMVSLGESADTAALGSPDGGDSWQPIDGLPAPGEEAGWAPVWAGGGRLWTLTGVDTNAWNEPEVCYADLDQCGQNPGPQLVASPDAAQWTAVELPGEPDEITGTADGRTIALTVERGGVAVHTLPSGTAPPEAPPIPEPKTVELVRVAEGERPEVGVRYHAPMYLHCGMGWLWFGDGTWRRTDRGADIETGAGDEATADWPVVGEMLYGYATLTDAEHLEYSTGDDVIATYRRARGAPGCD